MFAYNPKKWNIFSQIYAKTDTFKTLWPFLLIVGIYSLLIAYWETEILELTSNSWVKNIPTLHNMLSFVISLLLVFRTNTAYDRWWEGRKLWGGLVNTSRNLSIKLSAILPQDATVERNYFKNMIPAYAAALKEHLKLEKTRLSLDELTEIPINAEKHVPNQIAALITHKIYELYKKGMISGDELITINKEMTTLSEICGGCERIKNTPIPISYSNFIKTFIIIYIATLPFGYVFTLGYYVAPMVAMILYVLGSLELIAEEIEDPFGNDPNDLPTDRIADNIKRHVAEILD